MTAQQGDNLLLKVGNGAEPETFTVLGGLLATGFTFNGSPFISTNRESGAWQTILNNAGSCALQIQAEGRFTDSTTEQLVRQLAFSQNLRNYQLAFGNSDFLQGSFKIIRYQRNGTLRQEEIYNLTLESAGAITYTAAV